MLMNRYSYEFLICCTHIIALSIKKKKLKIKNGPLWEKSTFITKCENSHTLVAPLAEKKLTIFFGSVIHFLCVYKKWSHLIYIYQKYIQKHEPLSENSGKWSKFKNSLTRSRSKNKKNGVPHKICLFKENNISKKQNLKKY